MLTDDADNKRKAIAAGLTASSVKDFVDSLPAETSVHLLELLAATGASGSHDKRRGGQAMYPEVSKDGRRSHEFSSIWLNLILLAVLVALDAPGWHQGWQVIPRPLQPKPVQLQRGVSPHCESHALR